MATDGTDVRPDSVSDFGRKSLEEAKSLQNGTGSATGTIASARPAMSGLAEAVGFAGTYSTSAQALFQFSQEAVTGLQALGDGGITIADNYRNADLSQAQQMNSVTDAFNPAAGTPSILSKRAEDAAAAAAAAAARALFFGLVDCLRSIRADLPAVGATLSVVSARRVLARRAPWLSAAA